MSSLRLNPQAMFDGVTKHYFSYDKIRVRIEKSAMFRGSPEVVVEFLQGERVLGTIRPGLGLKAGESLTVDQLTGFLQTTISA